MSTPIPMMHSGPKGAYICYSCNNRNCQVQVVGTSLTCKTCSGGFVEFIPEKTTPPNPTPSLKPQAPPPTGPSASRVPYGVQYSGYYGQNNVNAMPPPALYHSYNAPQRAVTPNQGGYPLASSTGPPVTPYPYRGPPPPYPYPQPSPAPYSQSNNPFAPHAQPPNTQLYPPPSYHIYQSISAPPLPPLPPQRHNPPPYPPSTNININNSLLYPNVSFRDTDGDLLYDPSALPQIPLQATYLWKSDYAHSRDPSAYTISYNHPTHLEDPPALLRLSGSARSVPPPRSVPEQTYPHIQQYPAEGISPSPYNQQQHPTEGIPPSPSPYNQQQHPAEGIPPSPSPSAPLQDKEPMEDGWSGIDGTEDYVAPSAPSPAPPQPQNPPNGPPNVWNIPFLSALKGIVGGVVDGVEAVDGLLDDVIIRRIRGGAPAANQAIVESLIVTQIDEEKKSEYPECPICQENWNVGENVKLMPCKHFFHEECLGGWLNTRNSCPLCRYELPTDSRRYERYRRKRTEQEEAARLKKQSQNATTRKPLESYPGYSSVLKNQTETKETNQDLQVSSEGDPQNLPNGPNNPPTVQELASRVNNLY